MTTFAGLRARQEHDQTPVRGHVQTSRGQRSRGNSLLGPRPETLRPMNRLCLPTHRRHWSRSCYQPSPCFCVDVMHSMGRGTPTTRLVGIHYISNPLFPGGKGEQKVISHNTHLAPEGIPMSTYHKRLRSGSRRMKKHIFNQHDPDGLFLHVPFFTAYQLCFQGTVMSQGLRTRFDRPPPSSIQRASEQANARCTYEPWMAFCQWWGPSMVKDPSGPPCRLMHMHSVHTYPHRTSHSCRTLPLALTLLPIPV